MMAAFRSQALVPLLLLTAVSAAGAKERHTVTVSYMLAPQQALPEGLRAVAVIDAGVEAQGTGRDERERKWSTIAADMLQAMLHGGGQVMDPPLQVADRRYTRQVLQEQDLRLAGMVAGDAAARAARLLDVQALAVSRIVVQIDEQRGTKSTIDWVSLMGGVTRQLMERPSRHEPSGPPACPPPPGPPAYELRRTPDGRVYRVLRNPPQPGPDPRMRRDPRTMYDPRWPGPVYQDTRSAGGGLQIQTREVEEISRHLTVQCSFSLIDAATGQAFVQYAPPPYRKTDRKSPNFFFGGAVDAADLDPVDHFIGELVERATREFAAMIVPTRMSFEYQLVGRSKAAQAGIRALRADDYETALRQFEAGIARKPDEHESLFALGVICELTNRHDRALEFYRRAAAADADKEELAVYTEAKNRLTAHLPRILLPQTSAPAATADSRPSEASPGGITAPGPSGSP